MTDFCARQMEPDIGQAPATVKMAKERSNFTDFRVTQRVCSDVADVAQSPVQTRDGNKARLLTGVLCQSKQSWKCR